MTTGASFKRGKSAQDFETPANFMDAVKRRFGPIDLDLAASADNRQCEHYLSEADDSLSVNWFQYKGIHKTLWLNPPFADIAPWAKKCAGYGASWNWRILFLTPASIGSEWFRYYVYDKALVLALNPRLKFVGQKDQYPKDCILSAYGFNPGFEVWRWNE